MYMLPDLKGKEIIMYLRKSRQDDPLMTVEEVLEKHEQMIDEWLEQVLPKAGRVPDARRLREVVSGETLDSRPEMQKLLRLVESPEVKAIVCKEPSRLSRGDLQDIGYLVKVLMYTGTLVLTPRGSFDLRDERDREQFERELMRSNDYLKYQKKIMMDGKLLAVKNGCYIGSTPPYGYNKVSFKDGRRTCHTLKPNPVEAPIVRRIFELYVQGAGSIHICEALDAEHAKPPKGDKWAPESVNRMLVNEHYIGKVRWNYTQQAHSVEAGEIIKRKYTAEDYLIFEGRHDAIISQELWDAVQAIKGRHPRKKTGTELRNPLAGLLYCTCGKAMAYRQVTHKGKKIGLPRFNCGDQRCKLHGSVIIDEVMAEVAQVLQDCIDDFEVRIEQGVDNTLELHMQLVGRLEQRLEELQELEVKQWDAKTKGGMPDHVFERLNARTVAEIAEVTQALCDAKDAAPEHVDLQERAVTFRTALRLMQEEDAPAKEVNKLLKACIERIEYSRPKTEGYVGKNGNPEPFHLDFTLRV